MKIASLDTIIITFCFKSVLFPLFVFYDFWCIWRLYIYIKLYICTYYIYMYTYMCINVCIYIYCFIFSMIFLWLFFFLPALDQSNFLYSPLLIWKIYLVFLFLNGCTENLRGMNDLKSASITTKALSSLFIFLLMGVHFFSTYFTEI